MLAPRRAVAGALSRDSVATHRPAMNEDAEALASLKTELAFIHDSVARNKRELSALIGDADDRRLARAAEVLGAAVESMRGATDTILGLAETADDNARTLAASLKDEYKRGLAQDIQEQIVKIFEACNFQDLAGQHIAKVMTMLGTMEQRLDAILARCDGVHAATQAHVALAPVNGDGLLNGPKVAGDEGHASQHDIDRLFA
ncbi:MAG: protein phosphatase CheZ [Pseudolabrys sp.]|jgi:chemotaxis protein CheZ